MTRRPANDLLGAKLFIRYNYTKDNKQNNCVFIIESVGDDCVVAMMAQNRVGQSSHSRKEIHLDFLILLFICFKI
jgi:hypothetical protein